MNIEQLNLLLKQNLSLHSIIEAEVLKMQYGQLTVNVELKEGVADLGTLNIVINKRIRY